MNVNQKQAASEHPESDLIGTPLRDVAAKLGRHDVHLSAPSVNAGAELTRGKYPSGIGGAGAAGLVVRKTGQSSGAFVMTCAHVLGPKALVPNPDGDVVYSPALQTFLGIECNNSFGQVDSSTLNSNNALLPAQVPAQITIGQDSFGVDAALIQVSSNATATNIIPTIGQIADVRDLVQEWGLSTALQNTSPNNTLMLPQAQQLAVRKFGPITKYSEGTIVALKRQQVLGTAGDGALVFEIEAKAGQAPFSETYDLDIARYLQDQNSGITTVDQVVAEFKPPMVATRIGSASSTTIKVQGPTFSQQGDSGAPIVDQANKIVGFVSSGTFVSLYITEQPAPVLVNTGNTQAIFITPALQFLGVTFLSSGQQTAGATIFVPGMAIGPNQQDMADCSKSEQAWLKFSSTPAGERLSSVVRRHFEEVRQLAHHDRRVKLAWHRNKGPAFAAAFVRTTREPQRSMPLEIDGVQREQAILAMREALMSSGSEALRAAIIEHGDDLISVLRSPPTESTATEQPTSREPVQ